MEVLFGSIQSKGAPSAAKKQESSEAKKPADNNSSKDFFGMKFYDFQEPIEMSENEKRLRSNDDEDPYGDGINLGIQREKCTRPFWRNEWRCKNAFS